MYSIEIEFERTLNPHGGAQETHCAPPTWESPGPGKRACSSSTFFLLKAGGGPEPDRAIEPALWNAPSLGIAELLLCAAAGTRLLASLSKLWGLIP